MIFSAESRDINFFPDNGNNAMHNRMQNYVNVSKHFLLEGDE